MVKWGSNGPPLKPIYPPKSPTLVVLKKDINIKNNELMFFCIDDEKLLENYKAVWTKIENLKSIKLNALPAYDDRYIKNKIRTYGDKAYTNFRGLNIPEDDIVI